MTEPADKPEDLTQVSLLRAIADQQRRISYLEDLLTQLWRVRPSVSHLKQLIDELDPEKPRD